MPYLTVALSPMRGLSVLNSVMRWRCRWTRRLVFIDGRYHPQLSDDLAASGVEVSVDNQRQHLPDALQPEVFLHLTESPPRR